MKWIFCVFLLLFAFGVSAQHDFHPYCQGSIAFSPTPALRINAVADAYNITHYDIHLELYDTLLYTRGHVAITGEVLQHPMDSFWLELTSALTIDSIRWNGQLLAFNHSNDEVLVVLPAAIAAGQPFTAEVHYQGIPPQQANRRGMMLNNPGVFPVLFTHSSLFWAKNWLPVKQQLDDKIDSIDLHITTRQGRKVASHGLLRGIDTLANQQTRWHWSSRYPIAYYLVALSVSNYAYTERQVLLPGQTVPMPILDFSFQTGGPSAALLDTTPRVMQELSRYWGTYPFVAEKYGHAQTNMGGAMEHQTLSGMGFYNVNVIVHEAAHQWFGDYVTCATPSDIWLNEGFATYAESMFQEVFDSVTAAGTRSNWLTAIRGATTGSVYVPAGADFSRVLNSTLSYRKPALVLHNLRWLLGDSLFFGGLQFYLEQRRFGNATTEEFRVLMEQYTQRPLDTFINAWIYGEGYPNYEIRWKEQGQALLMDYQPAVSPNSLNFELPYPVTVVYTNGSRERLRLPGRFGLHTFPLAGMVQEVLADPEGFVIEGTQTVVIEDLTLALEAMNKTPWQIYPNPAKEQFTLKRQSAANQEMVRLFDLRGRLLQQILWPAGEISLDVPLHQIPAGTYLVQSAHHYYKLLVQP